MGNARFEGKRVLDARKAGDGPREERNNMRNQEGGNQMRRNDDDGEGRGRGRGRGRGGRGRGEGGGRGRMEGGLGGGSGAYSSPLMSALSFSHIGKREAEADPALVYSNAYPYTTTYAAAAYPYSHVATPLVRNVATPLVRTVASPYVNTVASHVVPAVASHTLTSYDNPNHYTA